MSRGRFIVIEGIDGSGKTTQLKKLATWLREQGLVVHEEFEPTSAVIGAWVRETFLTGKQAIDPLALQYLFVADKVQHVVKIKAALERGEWVVCDRYHLSSLAYGKATGIPDGVLPGFGGALMIPDMTLLLDLTVDQSLARVDARGEIKSIFEKKERLEAVRSAYHEIGMSSGIPFMVIDASADPDTVNHMAVAAIMPLL